MLNTHISEDIAGKSLSYLTVKSKVPNDEYILSDPLQPSASTSPKNQNTEEVKELNLNLEVKCEDTTDEKDIVRNLLQYVKPESFDPVSNSSKFIKKEESESKYVDIKDELQRFSSYLQNDEQKSWNHNETKPFSTCTKFEEKLCNIGLQDNVVNNSLAIEKLSETEGVVEDEEILPDIPSTLFQAPKKSDVSFKRQDTPVFSSTQENCIQRNLLQSLTPEHSNRRSKTEIARKSRTRTIKKVRQSSILRYTVPAYNSLNTQRNTMNLQTSRRIGRIEGKKTGQEIKTVPKNNEDQLRRTTLSEVRNTKLSSKNKNSFIPFPDNLGGVCVDPKNSYFSSLLKKLLTAANKANGLKIRDDSKLGKASTAITLPAFKQTIDMVEKTNPVETEPNNFPTSSSPKTRSIENPGLSPHQVVDLAGSSSDDDGENCLTDENTISDEIPRLESRNSKKKQSNAHQDISSHSHELTLKNSETNNILQFSKINNLSTSSSSANLKTRNIENPELRPGQVIDLAGSSSDDDVENCLTDGNTISDKLPTLENRSSGKNQSNARQDVSSHSHERTFKNSGTNNILRFFKMNNSSTSSSSANLETRNIENPELRPGQVIDLAGSSSDDDGENCLIDGHTISDKILTLESRNSKKNQCNTHQEVSSLSPKCSILKNSGTSDIFQKPEEIKDKNRRLGLEHPESSFQRSSIIVHNSRSFSANREHNQTTKIRIQQKEQFPYEEIQDSQNITAFCQGAETGVDQSNNERIKRVNSDFNHKNSSKQCKTKTVEISFNCNKKGTRSFPNLLNRSSYTAKLKRLKSKSRNDEYQVKKVLQMSPIGNLLNKTGSFKNLHSQSSAGSNSNTSTEHNQRNGNIIVENKNVNALNSAEKSIVRDKYKPNQIHLSKPLTSLEKPLKKLVSPENTVGNSLPHEDDSTVTTNHQNSHENSEPSMAGIINQCDYEVTALTNSSQTKEKENLITAEKIAITPKLNKKRFNEPNIAKTSLDSGIVVIDVDVVSTTQTNNTQLSKCEEKKDESPRKVGKHLCHKCNKYYATHRSLTRHLETHSDLDKYVCVQCCKAYHSRTGFDFHMRNVHSSESHKCSQCEKTYKSSWALRIHTRRNHGNKKLIKKPEFCDLCRKNYADKKSLSKHRNSKHKVYETAVRLYCNDCSASFFNRGELIMHIRARHMLPTISCEHCTEKFVSIGRLNTHLRRVHSIDKRPEFICHVCGKSTRSKTSLESHISTHLNEKPFVCEECGKSFRTSTNLVQHSHSHKDVRPFSCGLCDSSFRIRHHLRQHMSVHGMVSTSKYRNRRKKSSSSSSSSSSS